jgi:hypothetical protein
MRKSLFIGSFALAAMAMSAQGYGSYIEGFESMTPADTVNGQSGWAVTLGSTSNATVINDSAAAFAGDQYLQIKATGNDGPTVNSGNSPQTLGVNTNNEVSYKMRLDLVGASAGGLNFGLIGNNGAVFIAKNAFQTSGAISPDGSNYVTPTFSADTWYNVVYDLDSSNNTYRFRVIDTTDDSVLVDTTENFLTTDPVTNIYTAQLRMDGLDGANWMIDNLSIQDAPVPEPATGAVLLIGAGLMALRRRRKS